MLFWKAWLQVFFQITRFSAEISQKTIYSLEIERYGTFDPTYVSKIQLAKKKLIPLNMVGVRHSDVYFRIPYIILNDANNLKVSFMGECAFK